MDAGIKINARRVFVNHLTDFKRITKNAYTVMRYGTKYTISGGKHAGGRRNEWFVECKEWNAPIICTSVVDAIKMLDGM